MRIPAVPVSIKGAAIAWGSLAMVLAATGGDWAIAQSLPPATTPATSPASASLKSPDLSALAQSEPLLTEPVLPLTEPTPKHPSLAAVTSTATWHSDSVGEASDSGVDPAVDPAINPATDPALLASGVYPPADPQPSAGQVILKENTSLSTAEVPERAALVISAEMGEATEASNVPDVSDTSEAEGADPSNAPPNAVEAAEAEAEAQRRALIYEADRLWQMGERLEAERLYRKAKEPGVAIAPIDPPRPFSDPAELSPEGRVYWREAEAGRERDQTSRMMVGLELLVADQPDFIPGYLRYAEALMQQGRNTEAMELLERGVGRMGNVPELVYAQVETLAASDHLLEASIAARQFALLYPEHPDAEAIRAIATTQLEEFQDELRDRLRLRAIANVLTGTLSFALTGNLYGPLTTLQTTLMLLEGEDGIGEAFSNRAARQLDLIEDETLNTYVNDIGQRLAALTGREEFEYEFFIIQNNALNAFALPGGKIFLFSGAILQTESEAELAGLIAHELAHTVLSHGFQMMAESTLAGNTLQLLPYGGWIANLSLLRYSRDMERQADTFGTRLLATADYAADGLQNLMQTLATTTPDSPLQWLSTHPDTAERINNIALQIERNHYNLFAYEGMERHDQMRQHLRQLLGETENPQTTPSDTPIENKWSYSLSGQ